MSIRIRPSWKASWWQENIEYNTPSRKIGNFSQHFPIIWLGNLITLWEFGSHVLENMAWPFIRVLDLKCHLWICFWHYSWKLMRLSIGVYLNVDHHNDLAILVVPNQIVVSYIGWPHCWVTLNNLIPCGSYDRPFLWLEGHNCSFMFESSSSFALFQIKTSIQEISLCSITLTWKLEKVTFCTFKIPSVNNSVFWFWL